ncbi:MAG: hypothetical protein ACRDYD_11595, partial [Acidimicrobiales bacterium]
VFYLFGGILNVPYLALGSIYLLGGRRLGGRCAAGVSLGAAFAVGVLVTAPFTHALPLHRLAQGSAVFGPLPQVLAGVASGGAATVVVACALWSALRYRWGRMLAANVLIAVGTLVTGASGLLNSVVDQMTGFAVTLVIGISIIFVGFLVASGRSGQAPAAAASREVPAGVEPEAGVPGDAGDAPLLTPDLAGRRPGPGEVPQPASVYRSAR